MPSTVTPLDICAKSWIMQLPFLLTSAGPRLADTGRGAPHPLAVAVVRQ